MKTVNEHSEYLEICLRSYWMAHRKKHREFYRSKRDEIKDALAVHFAPKLAGKIIMSGSIMKSTELNTKFDIDLIVPFKHDAFKLEEMSKEVHQFLRRKFRWWNDWNVTLQRVSVGIRYEPCIGASVKFDVVPGREIGLGQYTQDRFLKLYSAKDQRHFQTNIHAQMDALKSAGGARNLIKLLKIWKAHGNGPKLKSFILEMLVLAALKEIPRDTDDLLSRLKMVLNFIKDNLLTIRLVDPGNSNNIVSDLLDRATKEKVVEQVTQLLCEIEENPTAVKKYFPANEQFWDKSVREKQKEDAIKIPPASMSGSNILNA